MRCLIGSSQKNLLLVDHLIELLEILSELVGPVSPRQLYGEDLKASHEGGEAGEGRLPAASDADQHCVSAGLAEHPRDAGDVLHSVSEENCNSVNKVCRDDERGRQRRPIRCRDSYIHNNRIFPIVVQGGTILTQVERVGVDEVVLIEVILQ